MLRRMESHQQREQCCFASTARTDDRYRLASVHFTSQSVQRHLRRTRWVIEIHITQHQARTFFWPRRTLWMRRRLHIRLAMQQFHQTLCGTRCTQDVAIDLTQHRKGAGQQNHIHNRLTQLACSGGAFTNRQSAQIQTPQQRSARGHDDETHQDRTGACATQGRT